MLKSSETKKTKAVVRELQSYPETQQQSNEKRQIDEMVQNRQYYKKSVAEQAVDKRKV